MNIRFTKPIIFWKSIAFSPGLNLPIVVLLCLVLAPFGAVRADMVPTRIAIPLDDPANWQVLENRGIPPHQISFSSRGLELRVQASAMPVIHPLEEPLMIREIRVRGRIDGTLRIPPGRQGEEPFDDYSLRVGLVEAGERTLGFFQRRIAPRWVRRLFELAPKDSGISRIHFFNLGMERDQIGRKREHSLSDLLLEEVVAAEQSDGRFDFTHRLDQPIQTLALWISSDGDDSDSHFTVLVEEIELSIVPQQHARVAQPSRLRVRTASRRCSFLYRPSAGPYPGACLRAGQFSLARAI